MYKFLRREKS